LQKVRDLRVAATFELPCEIPQTFAGLTQAIIEILTKGRILRS
jgi:hypothetical protein